MLPWDALRVLCLTEVGVALALLAKPPADSGEGSLASAAAWLREEILSAIRADPSLQQKAQKGAAGFALVCVVWRLLRKLGGATAHGADSESNAAVVGMLAVLLAWLLGGALQAAQELVRLRALVVEQRKAADEIAVLRMDCDVLKADAQKWEATAHKLTKQVVAIKKQAEGQANEYTRLLSENSSLRNQLSDFDALLGGSRKKAA